MGSGIFIPVRPASVLFLVLFQFPREYPECIYGAVCFWKMLSFVETNQYLVISKAPVLPRNGAQFACSAEYHIVVYWILK